MVKPLGFIEIETALPPTRRCFQSRLPVMASVAPCSQVADDQPQVRPDRNRNLMVGVQVAFTTLQPLAQFVQHPLGRRVPQLEAAAVRHNVRFPTAIYTSPEVPLETENPKPAMVGIVPTIRRRSSLLILLSPRLPKVNLTI
jgi:hypothetical protein